MSFAENFRAARKELKLTQEEVAKLIGIERSAVAHYENGTSLPHAGNLKKSARSLKYRSKNCSDKFNSRKKNRSP